MKFKDKVVLVTGGNSGIGRATALAFAKQGAKVVLAARRDELGNAIADEIKKAGGEAMFVKTDIANEAEVESLINTIMEKYGKLDVAVNNAGAVQAKPLHEVTGDELQPLFDTNVKGTFNCLKHEVLAMRKAKSGAILNVNTAGVLKNVANNSAFAASKNAIASLSASAAIEYGAEGIRVNQIFPALIHTPLMDDWLAQNPGFKTGDLAECALVGRIGEAEDCAKAILFLCSDDASFITGAALTVDGGFSLM